MLVPITFIEIIDRLAYYANAHQPFHCLARHKSMHRREHRHVICPLYVAASSLDPFTIWIVATWIFQKVISFLFLSISFFSTFLFRSLRLCLEFAADWILSNGVIKRIIFNGIFFNIFLIIIWFWVIEISLSKYDI